MPQGFWGAGGSAVKAPCEAAPGSYCPEGCAEVSPTTLVCCLCLGCALGVALGTMMRKVLSWLLACSS